MAADSYRGHCRHHSRYVCIRRIILGNLCSPKAKDLRWFSCHHQNIVDFFKWNLWCVRNYPRWSFGWWVAYSAGLYPSAYFGYLAWGTYSKALLPRAIYQSKLYSAHRCCSGASPEIVRRAKPNLQWARYEIRWNLSGLFWGVLPRRQVRTKAIVQSLCELP